MKAVIQRCRQASVHVGAEEISAIQHGLVVLLGVAQEDTLADVAYLVRKIAQLRIFEDEAGKMNHSIQEVSGSILSVSQFTLLANTKKGNRPSFVAAAHPDKGQTLYEAFNDQLRALGIAVQTGEFGAHMAVSLINDGPVTIVIDTHHP